MKRFFALCVLMLLVGCTTQKKYLNFDYSYSRSGGIAPIYENLWIKGNNAHYAFESQGTKIKKDFKLTAAELKSIETALEANNFRIIREDYKKLYDYVRTTIVVKKGDQSGSKSDASFIMEPDKERWENVVMVFRSIIDNKAKNSSSH